MRTTLYLVRHAATAANLAKPSLLQGRRTDPPLDPIGIAQAQVTRNALEVVPFAASFCSPLIRARQTATIIAPKLEPQVIEGLTECDVGRWEGLAWDTIRQNEPDEYARYMADPSSFGYPEGESFAEVFARSSSAITQLIEHHTGQTILVVSHHVVNRAYLAVQLGLPISKARQVALDNCGISVLEFANGEGTVTMLNSTVHLSKLAA
ncbi:MAG: histidine phosphatase family protein [Gemmataceae bacterium]